MKKLDILSSVKSNDRGGDHWWQNFRTPVVCLGLLVDAIIAPAGRNLDFTFTVIHPLEALIPHGSY
jgi:hypothetical protein